MTLLSGFTVRAISIRTGRIQGVPMTPGQIEDTATKIWCEWERLDEDANAAFVHAFIRRGKTDPFAWDRAADGATRLLREGVDPSLPTSLRHQQPLEFL